MWYCYDMISFRQNSQKDTLFFDLNSTSVTAALYAMSCINVFDDTMAPANLTEWDTDNTLTHWGLVTPYGDRDLGQHWLG